MKKAKKFNRQLRYKLFKIECNGSKQIIYSKRDAYNTFEDIRNFHLDNNKPCVITLKFKNNLGKWERINKAIINNEFYKNNNHVGFK